MVGSGRRVFSGCGEGSCAVGVPLGRCGVGEVVGTPAHPATGSSATVTAAVARSPEGLMGIHPAGLP
jgi:hypothetical protein